MEAKTLRNLYLDFFRQHGHAVIGSAPLIPEHDPSVLFTTAGMHPLVPFLLGEAHPAGKRLANAQKCLRTNDILEVGDAVHLTFFEMLGNWSLGDYWKEQAIRLNYALLTERLGLDPERLHVTCFAGDADAPRDDEAARVWRALGIPERRISFLPKSDNWWGPAGTTGPCGPDSEVFYDSDPGGLTGETPATNPQRFWEVCNNVFMEYDLQSDGRYLRLEQRNIDVGLGLERTLTILQGVTSPYETSLFLPIVETIRSLATHREVFAERVIADHVRAAVFILAEGIRPDKVDQPYVLRRLIRRAIRYGRTIGIDGHFLARLAEAVIPTLSDAYPQLEQQRQHICAALEEEETRFQRTLGRGETEFEKAIVACRSCGATVVPGEVVFRLYDTYGFPAELTEELAGQRGLSVDTGGFQAAFTAHQERSRQGAAGRFRGGLAERIPATTRLHTATHLLHESLRRVLGPHVAQRGSNITAERLRFDFAHGERLAPEQLEAVEALVNQQISRGLDVVWTEMGLEDAKGAGAIGLFEERYGDQVKVYTIGDFSKEICGGPHVEHTGELGRFRIAKEEAVGSGVRRIRAVLESDP
ncbi:MAG TPA: alanine--tRNA ligase [Roseiflexaceae bacterium]|nr:alanine--tRNA ligase [Roseiflexaceae bacterium]